MKFIIGLGSNIGDRDKNISDALVLLEAALRSPLSVSTIRETQPVYHPDYKGKKQDKFLNAAVLFESELSAAVVLGITQGVEIKLGRERKKEVEPWSARVIDLDILLGDSLVLEDPNLTLPHAELHKRDFALFSVHELWPEWVHPLLGLRAEELLREKERSEFS